jgi:hypothetical protein
MKKNVSIKHLPLLLSICNEVELWQKAAGGHELSRKWDIAVDATHLSDKFIHSFIYSSMSLQPFVGP